MSQKNETTRVLEAVERLLTKHVVFPSEQAKDAAVLWTATSWVAGHLETFGRLYFQSAEYGSGKTVAMEMVAELTRRYMSSVNATPAIIYRSIDNTPPTQPLTVCVDEADMLFGAAGSSSARTELLALLNAGYKRRATVPRARGQNDVYQFRAYSPVILAGKGKLPDALMTRSIVVRMRKATDEQLAGVTPFRERFHAPLFEGVRDALEKWSLNHEKEVATAIPDMPKGVSGRNAEVWEGLMVVADLAGGEWVKRAHDSAKFMVEQAKEETVSPTSELVKKAAEFFEDNATATPVELAMVLGKGWSGRAVTATMREIGVPKVSIRDTNGKSNRGFKKEHFEMVRSENNL